MVLKCQNGPNDQLYSPFGTLSDPLWNVDEHAMFGQFDTKKCHILAPFQNLPPWIKGQQQPGPISSKESNIWLRTHASPNVAGGPKASRPACAHRVPRLLPWGEARCQGEAGSCALWSLAHLSDVMASVASNKFIFWKDICITLFTVYRMKEILNNYVIPLCSTLYLPEWRKRQKIS